MTTDQDRTRAELRAALVVPLRLAAIERNRAQALLPPLTDTEREAEAEAIRDQLAKLDPDGNAPGN